MSLYSKYQHLLNIPYEDGAKDCYGLIRQFYKDEYGLVLRNYARPIDIFKSGRDLISENFQREGFEITEQNFRDLQFGDVLLIAIASPIMNHVGVYVGNQQFLHHLYNRPSSADNYSTAWQERTLSIARHPFVTEKNDSRAVNIDLFEMLPPHVKHRYSA